MANILPKESLRSLYALYRTRAVFVGSLVASVCAIVALLALVPAYALLYLGNAPTAGEPQLVSSGFEPGADREAVTKTQVLVKEFKAVATSTLPMMEVLQEVLAARPSGVRIGNISIERGEEASVTVSGTISSRGAIEAYRTALGENPRFESVTVPIGILAGVNDDKFTMTIKTSI